MTKKDERLVEIHREIQDSLQRTVRISHDEATRIATADLLAKYKSAKGRNVGDATVLRRVLLRYYLTADEFELYT